MKKVIGSIPIVGDVLKKTYSKLRRARNNYYQKLRPRKAEKYGLIVPQDIALFNPARTGNPQLLSKLTVVCANQTMPLINQLYSQINTLDEPNVLSIEEFSAAIGSTEYSELSNTMEGVFNKNNSDKADKHNYHLVYAALFQNKTEDITGLLEIGIGTNNTKVFSHMGANGTPGASLRSFTEILPNAMCYGADFDKSILFEEDRIKTFFVDQTSAETLDALDKSITQELDVIIDDGLHAPNANLATFIFALKRIENKKGGIIVIEDIQEAAIPVWKLVSNMLKDKSYQSYIVETMQAYMFVCIKE